MSVKELEEALAAYPDDMEVMIESDKNALGTFSINSINKCSVERLQGRSKYTMTRQEANLKLVNILKNIPKVRDIQMNREYAGRHSWTGTALILMNIEIKLLR